MSLETDTCEQLVRADSYLTLHYCIQIMSGPAAGTVFINTFDSRPATLQLGVGQWAEGLEAVLIGLREGSTHHVDLTPEQAYGERNPALVQWVSQRLLQENLAQDQAFQPGDTVAFQAQDGTRYSGVLKQSTDESALFDFNHPLAGAAIRLDVKILGIL